MKRKPGFIILKVLFDIAVLSRNMSPWLKYQLQYRIRGIEYHDLTATHVANLVEGFAELISLTNGISEDDVEVILPDAVAE